MRARYVRRPALTFLGIVALVVGLANPAAAPPGDLDPTFDGDGKVTTDFAGSRHEAYGVAIQTDGKIVAAGDALVSGDFDFALTRYNSDGSLDPTFDGDGKVTTDFSAGFADAARSVAIQGDGKIVAAGFADIPGGTVRDFALARYNSDGSLDPTFDGDGMLTTDFAGNRDEAHGVAIQTDGKIVAAGCSSGCFNSSASDFAVARYNSDGSLDPTFDGDGKVTSDFAGGRDEARDVAIQTDGKIVAAGFAFVSGTFDFALARYKPDGSLDTTFGAGLGRVATDFAGSGFGDEAHGVAIQTDGKIVAAGLAFVSGTNDFALARYNTDGSLDTTFSADGKVTTDFGGSRDEARDVAIQTNGKIVVAGCSTCFSSASDFALARYNSDGSLDTTFSADGKVTTDFAATTDDARDVAIQGDGKIVAAGTAVPVGTFDFALARYTVCRQTSRPTSIPVCP